MVRVRRGAGGHGSAQVARDDDVGIGAAHALLRPFAERIDPARSHGTVAATHPHGAVAALRLLGRQAIPDRFDAFLARPYEHFASVVTDTQLAQFVGSIHVKFPR